MRKVTSRLLIAAGVVLGVPALLAALLVGLYIYGSRPLEDGAQLAGGSVTALVSGHVGPITIASYVFTLRDGGIGLVDAGEDPQATKIRAALQRMGKSVSDVRVILVTHGHGDHMGGAVAFPHAEVYALEPDASAVRRRRDRAGAVAATHGLTGAQRLDLFGTLVEVHPLPGHTEGSAAFLIHGVLFLGDTAHALRDGTVGENRFFSEDADGTTRTLKALADQLTVRPLDVSHLVFGHSGPLDSVQPLIAWASGS